MSHTIKLITIVLLLSCGLVASSLASSEIQTLVPSDGNTGDNFGSSIDIDGDIAVIGAPFVDVGGSLEQGAVFIFMRDETGSWQETRKITVPDGAQYDQFGFSVAIDGERIVVGAEEAAANGNSSEGVAYVFERNEGGADAWGQVAKLIGPNIIQNLAEFGHSVAIDGDFILVGVPGAGPSTHGAAYLYARNEGGTGNWGLVASFYDDIYDTNSSMGTSVAIDGDRVVVGALYLDMAQGSYSNEGGIYIYERHHGGTDAWGQTAKIFGSDATNNDRAGRSVAIEGNLVAFGASNQEGGSSGEGHVYILENIDNTPTGWVEVAVLSASDASAYASFGSSLDLHLTSLIVGAPGHGNDTGQAYLYSQNEGGDNAWGEADQLNASNGAANYFQGSAVAVGDGVMMVGAVGANEGLVHIYELPGSGIVDVPNSMASLPIIQISPAVPNPFNPITTISFVLNQPGSVTVEIFDIRGHLVDTLLQQWLESGRHELNWDASRLSSGVYSFRVSSHDASAVERCVLIK